MIKTSRKFFGFYKNGFTLVEMLVSIAILMIITSAAVGGFGAFNDELALTNAAYEIAVTIRQMQYQGLGSKFSSLTNNTPNFNPFDHGYGARFQIGSGADHYKLFVDTDDNDIFIGEAIDDDVGDCNGSKRECLGIVRITHGIHVSKILKLVAPLSGGVYCENGNFIDVVYERVSPLISLIFDSYKAGSANASGAVLELSSPKGLKRYIIIRDSGLVSVSKTPPCTLP